MKQFLRVLQFELGNYFKNKSFMITTLILMLVIAGVLVIPTFFFDDHDDQTSNVAMKDEVYTKETFAYIMEYEDPSFLTYMKELPMQFQIYDDEKEMIKAIKAEKVNAGFILHDASHFSYVVKDRSLDDFYATMFSDLLTKRQKQVYLENKGLQAQDYLALEAIHVSFDEVVLGKDSVHNFAYCYVLVFVIYFLILFYGQMIAVSITNEKSNRAIEILVTSVNSNSLIFGKVLAGAIAGILQASAILGTGFITYHFMGEQWHHQLDMLFHIPIDVWVVYLIFGLFSYLLYSFIFGALGALVSKTEDISKSATPVTLIYIASFFIAIFGMSNSNGMLMKVASFIPFSSGNAMFVRYSMGQVALWEVGISAFLLIASCFVVGMIAAKIFRFATLHYGNPMKITTALKKLKHASKGA